MDDRHRDTAGKAAGGALCRKKEKNMKIAVNYENGMVFQHFGRTEAFKLYEVEDGKVVSSEVVSTNGTGHEALAGFLAQRGVDAVLCGGLGAGMQNALAQAGIEVISGVTGNTDEAVEAYLRGDLETAGVNCDHHDHEGHHEQQAGEGTEEEGSGGDCGGDCGEGCGSSCGGGCGGCHREPVIILEGRNAGKTCRVHYKGTFNDGTQFDSSYDRGEPLEFLCGAGMMIPGFDKAVVNMEPGQKLEIHLMPEEAYGMPDPNKYITLEIAQLQGAAELVVGDKVYLRNTMGQSFPVVVSAKDETNITFDANHEMAGKELNFLIELVEVR